MTHKKMKKWLDAAADEGALAEWQNGDWCVYAAATIVGKRVCLRGNHRGVLKVEVEGVPKWVGNLVHVAVLALRRIVKETLAEGTRK